MVKNIKTAVLLLLTVFCIGLVSSQENITNDTFEVGEGILTPDSPFYFLDIWGDNIKMSFYKGEKKAQVALEVAEERASEMKLMASEQKNEALQIANREHKRIMNMIGDIASEMPEANRTRLQENLYKHTYILQRVLENAPEQARYGLSTAINNSRR
ncbi:MAG: DUF5667 domain-containing protein, partial [Candidatus Nanoarchaeia archaeon]